MLTAKCQPLGGIISAYPIVSTGVKMKLRLFGKIILVRLHWGKGKGLNSLWWVTETHDTVRQYFLFNISLMEDIERKCVCGIIVHVLWLAITVGWA